MDEKDDRNMLYGEFAIDAWLVLHNRLTPEQVIDQELTVLREALLKKFYERFPDQRATGGEDAKG